MSISRTFAAFLFFYTLLQLPSGAAQAVRGTGFSTNDVVTACHPIDKAGELRCKGVLEKAMQGDARSQLLVALAYGYAVDYAPPEFDTLLWTWLDKAVAQDYAPAQYIAGVIKAMKQDPEAHAAAKILLERAAKQGHVEATTELAHRFYGAEGGSEADLDKAIQMLRSSVESKDTNAAKYLQSLYETRTRTLNDKSGFAYFQLIEKFAVHGNVSEAQSILGIIYSNGSNNVAAAPKEACRWFMIAAGKGEPTAMHNFALCLFRGRGESQSYADAVKWFEKLDKVNRPLAGDLARTFGSDFYFGSGVPRDYDLSRQWTEAALKRGNRIAVVGLAQLYEKNPALPNARIVAYALWNLLAAEASFAEESRNRLATAMSTKEVLAGQQLAARLKESKDIVATLDAFQIEKTGKAKRPQT